MKFSEKMREKIERSVKKFMLLNNKKLLVGFLASIC